MRLLSLSLKNIRSYIDATVEFPEGSILLSGDVGAGKTTLLLAIEFAFFGLFRGELAAGSLLRHGADSGEVTLSFAVDSKSYTVTRTLKRDSKSVKQGNGSLNGESLTPVELKARILAVIGYSQDLLTKAKSLVFRYTVYTPQEAMKQIIFESPDARLETLRKLFGMDRYKLAQTNASSLLKELRAEQKALALQLEELPHKERAIEQLQERLAGQEQENNHVLGLVAAAKRAAKEKEDAVKEAKEEGERYQRVMREHATLQSVIAEKKRRLEQVSVQGRAIKEQLAKLVVRDTKELQSSLQKKEEQQRLIEERLERARAKQATINARKLQAMKAKDELDGLAATCPLCKQEVPHEHKDSLLAGQQSIIAETQTALVKADEFISQASEKLLQLKRAWQEANQQLQEAGVHNSRREQLAAQEEQLLVEQAALKDALEGQQEVFEKKQAELQSLAPAKERLQAAEDLFRAEQRKEQALTVEQARLEATMKAGREQLLSLQKESARLQGYVRKKQQVEALSHWLKESFQPLTQAIERAVFASLHHEFDQLFQNWFNQLLEDDALQVRLDKSFSPLVSLNGYDTEVEALSGGEKTALALAYRLSLNQVINEFLTTIQTRGVLILDEPTDGFSTQQLDRMRDVLEQLRIGQLIMVSHEPKVEGFVQHIIRVSKQEQQSVIEQ